MPRALVTGATGLLGAAITERLLDDGWAVQALVRDPAGAGWLRHRGVALHTGDVGARDALDRATAGCDVVFHAAAAVVPRGGWEAFRIPNVEGTRNVIAAAARARARLMHVSSVAVYGAHARYRAGKTDESVLFAPLPEAEHYARSKREAEEMALGAHARGELWATAIRPCVIYGRRDRQFVPRAARLLRLHVAPVIGGGHTTLPLVHAANVADAALRAATHDVAGGKAYNTANDDPLTVRDFIRLAAEGLDTRVLTVPIPHAVALGGLSLLKGVLTLAQGRATGVMAGATLNFLTKDNPFSSDRARRELGWLPPVRHVDGVPDAFRFWKESPS